MQHLKSAAGIDFGVLEAADMDEMACLLGDAFGRHEPMALAVGLAPNEIRRFVLAFGPKALSEQLTIIAREQATGTMVGAMLAEDFATSPPDGLAEIAPLFASIGALLDGLDTQYRETRAIRPGTYLHFYMLGVLDTANGRGIATNLVTTCLAHAKRRGYTFAVAETSGGASQHIFRKLGFTERFTTLYRDFLFNEDAVFASIVGVEGTILMDREI